MTDLTEHPIVFAHGPELAVLVAMIAAQSTRLENMAALAFCELLKAEEEAALAIYLLFKDHKLRDDIFNVVAKTKLPEDLQKQAEELQKKMRSTFNERNDIIHGTWAITPNLASSLLMTSPKDTILSHLREKSSPPEMPLTNQEMAEKYGWLEYKKDDFNNTISRLEKLEEEYSSFVHEVRRHVS